MGPQWAFAALRKLDAGCAKSATLRDEAVIRRAGIAGTWKTVDAVARFFDVEKGYVTMLPMILLAVAAQAAGGTAPTLVDALATCRSIAANEARLACFDRAAGAIVDAQRQKDIVVLDRGEVQKAKRSLFGFSLPSIKLFGDGKDDAQLKQLVGTMQSAESLPGGLIRFALDDGGMWETTEQVMMPPRRGDVVTIKAGALGSYIATAPGRRSARVRRIR
jgi:hypothetical protein